MCRKTIKNIIFLLVNRKIYCVRIQYLYRSVYAYEIILFNPLIFTLTSHIYDFLKFKFSWKFWFLFHCYFFSFFVHKPWNNVFHSTKMFWSTSLFKFVQKFLRINKIKKKKNEENLNFFFRVLNEYLFFKSETENVLHICVYDTWFFGLQWVLSFFLILM